ncbi:MAG TPA: DUF4340 domain-containing protein [Terriglobia bacterium]|nr:DUF4340 domain-containing protein [Terriglobia bacterium]
MKKQYVNTLLAVVFLAALWASFTYFDKRKSGSTTANATSESKPAEKLFGLDGVHVQAITLKTKDVLPIACQRESGKWVIVAPEKLLADQSGVDTLLNTLTSATIDQVVDPHPANLKDFGLDPPTETLDLSTDAKPAQFTMMLGDETPTGNGMYAQVSGNPRVFTLPVYLKTSLTKSLFDLRDKRAVTLDADQIQKIEVESKEKGKSYTLQKNPEGVWDLVLPPSVRADRSSVDSLVSDLRTLSMASIVAEDKKKSSEYGLAAPALTLKLASPSGSQTVIIGKKDGDKYDAANSGLPPIFTLSSNVLTQFQKNVEDLRDKQLFSFSPFEVSHFEVVTPKGHWTFEKQKDKWRETVPAAKDVSKDKVDSLLQQVGDLRAESFPQNHPTGLAAFGLTKPAYRFEAQWGSKKEVGEAAKVGDHIYARRSTDVAPSELSKTALDSIEKTLSGI